MSLIVYNGSPRGENSNSTVITKWFLEGYGNDNVEIRYLKKFKQHLIYAEEMINYETGMTKTSHTLNPVECIYIAKDSKNVNLIKSGKLSDIAPTVLKLLNLEVPREMTADNLILK